MDAGYISALAALAGSAIGALASFATSWLNQASQARAARRAQDQARREALYGDFIREASHLFADAFEHELDDPSKLVRLYAIVSMLRLFGHPQTLQAAEDVMKRIGATYFEPNKELRRFADITHAGDLDPLYAFSQACRDELLGGRAWR
jgi:UTP:GlnB (protein PII) uridylyltransferase